MQELGKISLNNFTIKNQLLELSHDKKLLTWGIFTILNFKNSFQYVFTFRI